MAVQPAATAVSVRYAAEGRYRVHVVVESSDAGSIGDEGKVRADVIADVAVRRVAAGDGIARVPGAPVEIAWTVTEVRELTGTQADGDPALGVGARGVLVLDRDGEFDEQASQAAQIRDAVTGIDIDPEMPEADQVKSAVAAALLGAFVWPRLPDEPLVQGVAHRREHARRWPIQGTEIEFAGEVLTTLVSVSDDPDDPVATVDLQAQVEGKPVDPARAIAMTQAAEGRIDVGLLDGRPRRIALSDESTIATSDEPAVSTWSVVAVFEPLP